MKVYLISIIYFLISSVLQATTSNIEIMADQFELDANTNLIKVLGNIKVVQNNIVLTGDRGQYNQKMQSIKLYDNIKIMRDSMKLTCDFVEADGKNNIIIAKQNVQFSLNEIKGSANNSFFDIEKNTIEFTGAPKVIQNKNKIEGI